MYKNLYTFYFQLILIQLPNAIIQINLKLFLRKDKNLSLSRREEKWEILILRNERYRQSSSSIFFSKFHDILRAPNHISIKYTSPPLLMCLYDSFHDTSLSTFKQ